MFVCVLIIINLNRVVDEMIACVIIFYMWLAIRSDLGIAIPNFGILDLFINPEIPGLDGLNPRDVRITNV